MWHLTKMNTRTEKLVWIEGFSNVVEVRKAYKLLAKCLDIDTTQPSFTFGSWIYSYQWKEI